MKRRPLALPAAAILCLSSCTLLFRGTYPGDLAQARAHLDLSAEITAEDAPTYSLSIVKQDGREILLLSSPMLGTPSRVALEEVSPDLDVLATYTADDLGALSPASQGFIGDGAVARFVDNHVILGNLDMVVGSGGLQPVRKLSPLASVPTGIEAALGGWSVAGSGAAAYTWTNFYTRDDGQLHYDAYAGDWSSVSHVSVPIGGPYKLSAVLSDPEEPSSDVVWLVFNEPGGNQKPSVTSFVPVSKTADLLGGFPDGPILTAKAAKVFTMQNLSSRDLFATSDCFIAYDESSREWIRFLPGDPTNVERVAEGKRPESLRTVFSFSGHSYYVWDSANRTLTAYDSWW